MTELKTKQTNRSVQKFLNGLADEQKRKDSFAVMEMMKSITRSRPKMWGSSIVGFGKYRYKYGSGREGDWFLTGFSPRKQALTLYLMSGVDRHRDLLEKLGKHKTGIGCLYIKKLDDVHTDVLEELIKRSVRKQRAR